MYLFGTETSYCYFDLSDKALFINISCRRSESKDNIKRQVFVQPLENVRNMITPLMKQFNEQSFQSTVTELMELFTDTAEFCVTHGNFTADNIVCRTQCVSKVTVSQTNLTNEYLTCIPN